ncbi:acetylcholine receptor subunit alpha-type acr-16 [Octopus bimaculoides]|nr:acetylcholine receptor subunit alpha-type acr-16 [Octopus bimaculoides]
MICVNRSKPSITDEQRLLLALMADYDKATRPVFNASHPVNVYLGITLTQIFDVDERNQVLTTNIWLDQSWKDEKLIWDPADYNNLSVLRIPCNKLWLPDIVLYNSADDYTHGYMQALTMVHSDGTVFWPPIVKLRSTCDIKITYFPFDDQICRMKLGSWAYDGFQVNVHDSEKAIDLDNFVSNGEWLLVDVKVKKNVVYYACCDEPFPDVTFYIHMRRRTLYYTYNVIIPCVMLSILTLMGFWMRPDSGEKVTLGLTVLLAFSVFMLLIAENMPATSNFVPLIGIYLTVIMALTSLSVILAVIVSNINNRGFHQKKLPSCVLTFITLTSKLVCYKLEYIHKVKYEEIKSSSFQVVVKRNKKKYTRAHPSESGCNLIEFESNDQTAYSSRAVEDSNLTHRGTHRTKGVQVSCGSESPRSWEAEEILAKLQILLNREEEKLHELALMKQWQEVAEVVDRLLFWMFVLSTLFCSLSILVFIPMTKSKQAIDIEE